MYVNQFKDDTGVIEDESPNPDLNKQKITELSHPTTGFPKAFNRNKHEMKDSSNLKAKIEVDNVVDAQTSGANALGFKFTQNDLLKLRWTNPIGEDEYDIESLSKLDMNLHSLRFNFEGYLCDNTNIEEKSKNDGMFFYKGLHHHSEQGEFEGYTIPELMHLSRSSNISQRCLSIRTLGNIFLRIREFHTNYHQKERHNSKYMLGFMFGIHRWFKYLTGDLSIHYLLLNMMLHESFASKTAEQSVVALNNLISGGSFSSKQLEKEHTETRHFKPFKYFLTTVEFVFEMMNEKFQFPAYLRDSVITQRLDFSVELRQKKLRGERFNGLSSEEHLIKIDLPDGRTIELLRDVMHEIFQFKPLKYDLNSFSEKNPLMVFFCNMAQNKHGSLDSRVSCINLIRLFIERDCTYDQTVCFKTLAHMTESIGDELFEYSSSDLASQDFSNHSQAELLFNYLYLIRECIQSIFQPENDENDPILKDQREFFRNFLVKSILQIIRIVLLTVLECKLSNDNGISEYIQLSFVEGVKIIGLMTVLDIFLEDLSIYCKSLIHFMNLIDLNNSSQCNMCYHLYMLGHHVLIYSQNYNLSQEHIQFIEILGQFSTKILRKLETKESEFSERYIQLDCIILLISLLRFQRLYIERSKNFPFQVCLELYFEFNTYFKGILIELCSEDFDFNLIMLESGLTLETEMGTSNIQNILLNNKNYGNFFIFLTISTFLSELSQLLLLPEFSQNEKVFASYQLMEFSYKTISSIYEELSRNYNLPNHSRMEEKEFLPNSTQLFDYDLCYFETLDLYDEMAIINSNCFVRKNSIYLQLINSNLINILIFLSKFSDPEALIKFTKDESNLCISEGKIPYSKKVTFIESTELNGSVFYERLLPLIFNNKNIQDYSFVLFWILKFSNNNYGSFPEFSNAILDKYLDYLDPKNSLIINPLIYSQYIVFNQITSENKCGSSSGYYFLINLFKNIFDNQLLSKINSIEVINLVAFISKFTLENSINCILSISKMNEEKLENLNSELVGSLVLEYLRLFLDIWDGIFSDIGVNTEVEDELTNLEIIIDNFRSGQKRDKFIRRAFYDLSNIEENNTLNKMVDSLISAFCDSNLYFSENILDCFYFLFSFLILQVYSGDRAILLKIISNIKVMKFLLFHREVDISNLIRRTGCKNMNLTEVDDSQGGVSNIITELISLYKESINPSTRDIFILLYCSSFGDSEKSMNEMILKLYEETGLDCIKEIICKS
ncbi:putative RNA polymerase II-associated protein 1 [Cryptosporidium felis]|nr:putative RNA polymerase II-associated protein 1 [Cryptosporidium felis]